MLSREYAKYFLSMMTGKLRGPKAVLRSMRRGMRQLGMTALINPPHSQIKHGDIVHVLSGVQALRECIELKKAGKIGTLVAGPSISVIPSDDNGLLLDPSIDQILVPSPWVKNLYSSLHPEIAGKTYPWPAGVAMPSAKEKPQKQTDYLIYVKNVDHQLLTAVESQLTKHHKSFKKVIYGEFEQKEFFDRLNKAKAMIYLSPSESQGLALHEAWIRDVPTLVWSRGHWEYKGMRWEDPKISAPYLSDEIGSFFTGTEDFESALIDFERRLQTGAFAPKAHSLEHFTDAKSVQALLDILGRHNV